MYKKSAISITKSLVLICSLGASLIAIQALAKSTPEEFAKLGIAGTELTPAGAIRAGNADGTIPEWRNEPIPVPRQFKPSAHYVDPFPDDKVLFTITAQNYKNYADKLTPGHQKMFETYPDYKMNIYPTRRTAVFQEAIYKAALENAQRAEFVENPDNPGGFGFKNALLSWAFPTPHNGMEAFLNFSTRPQPQWAQTWESSGAAVASDGSYQLVKTRYDMNLPYANPENTLAEYDPAAPMTGRRIFHTVHAPAKIAGQVTVARDPMTFTKNVRQAWAYAPGQRRVKRAPQIAYDYPATGSDGLMTTDQGWGFNGPTDRYKWTLEGRQEIYVPYNSYKLASGDIKIKDIISPSGRLNQDLARYELHRVWKIVGSLREGTSHVYAKRTMYLDEDSWWLLSADLYDGRGQLWRMQELHPIQWYDQQLIGYHLNLTYDMQAGRAMIVGLTNEDPDMAPDFTWRADDSYYTPASARREGAR